MGVRVKGHSAIKASLERTKSRMDKQSLAWLRKAAQEIRDAARDNAPIDTGDLEGAIVVQEAGGGRSTRGTFAAKTMSVGVDESLLNLEEHADHDYATTMHESTYNLGPRSQAKASTGKDVGPKYLERALHDNEARLKREAEKFLQEAVRP